ncbi:TOM1-like protein 6 [Ziziphus jujuba]|uniref:TOM1-like protein 6 n=1 Tax=Ziziphus jujuba TaxID=326968 RepID=A0ABM3I3M3_ZIZJJ|nr:TOM1-like protein 6 [Ziziphus jujuba]
MMAMATSSSSSSATVAVEKATSDLLISPDWTMNIDICDSVNSHHWQAKDVVKALKRRLQHRNSKVQLLSLTLLETMVKNCGDYVHFQIAERNILGEMIKIVRKKADMQVREKILVLLDSWQEAFGGPGGKYPQYYWAYEELRRSGVVFPKRSLDAAPPILTPPVTPPSQGYAQPGFGMPSNSARRLDETMATEIESLSLSSMDSMRNVVDLLSDMLQAVTPGDREAVKDEVIVDLVNRCRANQKKLMQMLTSTGDEELLGRGLELNDILQNLLAKHDAIASGSPLPNQVTNVSPQRTETSASSLKQSEVRDSSPRDLSPRPNPIPSPPASTMTRSQIDEDEEEEDEFAQLARRHSKGQPMASPSSSNGNNGSLAIVSTSSTTVPPAHTTSTPGPSNALVLPDPPAPVKTKEQDILDLLSLTLTTTEASPHVSPDPPSNQNLHQVPVSPSNQGYQQASPSNQGYQHASPSNQGYPQGSQTYQGQNQYNSYVAPWARPQPQLSQSGPQPQLQPHPQVHSQPHLQPPHYSTGYPPPPWAATPGYFNSQNQMTSNMFLTPRANTTRPYTPVQGVRPLQHHNSFPSREINGSAIHGDFPTSTTSQNSTPAAGQKPYIPPYRLFEDLNVFGSADGKLKMTSSGMSSSLAGASGPSMVGGSK